MAIVTYSDGVEKNQTLTSEAGERIWISPSTMDSNDTVVLPTMTGRTARIISCWDNDTGDAATASISTLTVTIDAAGGTTDHVYVLKYMYE